MSYYFDQQLRSSIEHILLPDVQLPGQYIGGELGQIVKPAESVCGRLCFAFPDSYPIGMSNTALLHLYTIMNRKDDWSCERVFCPYPDMETKLRENNLPLYSLETFSPLAVFDVVGFTFQYELCYSNVLTMLDLGRIPLHRWERTEFDPLIIAGGPGVFNPEPMSHFIDAFVIGDGEESLQEICQFWKKLKQEEKIADFTAESYRSRASEISGTFSDSNFIQTFADYDPNRYRLNEGKRRKMLLAVAREFPWVYVPEFYEVHFDAQGRASRPRPFIDGVPEFISPAIVKRLDDFPPAEMPIVPLVESVQDRVSIEIMRGCPQKCRFCQSSPIKRPLRFRSIDQIVKTATKATAQSGVPDVTLLSLSSSEYPKFEELMNSLRHSLDCGVSISVPSLRVNHQLSDVMRNLTTERSSGITMAPEAAFDAMRKRIAKKVTNDDLVNGCRAAFENGFYRIKMYFMCGFQNETEKDVDGIIQLCEEIAKLGKEIRGRFPTIVANVSNFVPKPQTPLQWNAMATADYFREAHFRLKRNKRLKSVEVKYHDLKTSLLEGLLTRGDRRVGDVIETAWRNGARFDAWSDYFRNEYWQTAIESTGIDVNLLVHTEYPTESELPWDHITVYCGKEKLLKEFNESKLN